MNQRMLRHRGKLLKRVRQLAYLLSHPIGHWRCMMSLGRSPLTSARWTSLKYLGDHLALSLRTSERREALLRHHAILAEVLSSAAADKIQDGTVIWQREVPGEPPLSLVLERSTLAPMEGELQLKFSFRSDLQFLTFLFAPGHLFNSQSDRVLFIGGMQGHVGRREEIRTASKLNHEIAPAAMLILAVQAIAKQMGAEMLAIGEASQISRSYSPSLIKFDYAGFWAAMGGSPRNEFFALPLASPQRPLSSVALSHRSRTRRKREEKRRIRAGIETGIRQLLAPEMQPGFSRAFNTRRKPSLQPRSFNPIPAGTR